MISGISSQLSNLSVLLNHLINLKNDSSFICQFISKTLYVWLNKVILQLSPETSFTKPKPTKPVFRPIRIQNLRFNPIRAFVLFLINGSGDPLSLIIRLWSGLKCRLTPPFQPFQKALHAIYCSMDTKINNFSTWINIHLI